jgi:hypothetical protein
MHSIINVQGVDVRIQGRLLRIARREGEMHRQVLDPESLLEGLRRAEVRVDLFTFIQGLPKTAPKYPYPWEWDNLAVLPISTFDHWWTKQLDNKTRNMVRKGEKKGLILREVPLDDSLVQGIWEIYNESPVRQGKRFPHFGKDFETVRKVEATFLDSSTFIGAFLDDKLIGFAKLTYDEARVQAKLVNILSLIQHRDRAPTNALIAHAVRACATRGIHHLVYSNFAYGKRKKSSLSDFKERNGFQRVDVPRYYVPLTALGQIALRLGLHHRLIDWVPESIAAKAREFRRVWYRRVLHVVSEPS